MGIVQSMSFSALRVFGYFRKEEVIGNNVKMLMPVVYQIHHDEFIKSALQKESELISSKERSVYGLH